MQRHVEMLEQVRRKQIEHEKSLKEELARKEALNALRQYQKMQSKEGEIDSSSFQAFHVTLLRKTTVSIGSSILNLRKWSYFFPKFYIYATGSITGICHVFPPFSTSRVFCSSNGKILETCRPIFTLSDLFFLLPLSIFNP